MNLENHNQFKTNYNKLEKANDEVESSEHSAIFSRFSDQQLVDLEAGPLNMGVLAGSHHNHPALERLPESVFADMESFLQLPRGGSPERTALVKKIQQAIETAVDEFYDV